MRIPLERHDIVVSVLQEAARVNADLEAYVEPAGERERRALSFAQWDRAAEGVAGYLARRGVTKGDVFCPDRLSDYKAPDALAVVEELPLTPMMKVQPVRLGVLAAGAADVRRFHLARGRGGGLGMVGSGPGREASDEKERA
jgi:acyl-CoA synthetase (AMP-forming)/AMP-acid ligase II